MKRSLSLSLVFLMVLSLFATSFASSNHDWILAEIEKTNEEIYQMIDDAKEEAEIEIEKYNKQVENYEAIGERYNVPVDRLIEIAEKSLEIKLDIIIYRLVKGAELKSDIMIRKAARYGIEAVCEYVEVEIGGRTVLVDPLRVIEW